MGGVLRSFARMALGLALAIALVAVLLLPLSAERPASLLRTHPNCSFFIDAAAASKLPRDLVARNRAGSG